MSAPTLQRPVLNMTNPQIAVAARPLTHPVRFVTAASLFDGHDAAINLMRRLLQSSGVEVIHLGHNRAVHEVVEAAIQEDVQGIAISSYQGGHVEYFKFMIDLLRERGAGHIQLFGGGGGVIIPPEIRELEAYGVHRIFSPEDGRRLGLQGMINQMLEATDFLTTERAPLDVDALRARDAAAVARAITLAELGHGDALPQDLHAGDAPVIGITGTGGAGKSSLTDELLRRLRLDAPDAPIAVICVDPTRRRTGGALLGDRIRMNTLGDDPNLYMRSLATRRSGSELSTATRDAVDLVKKAGYALVIVETSGIGQGDAGITDIADLTLYAMTSEFGAASQLEKIEMLDAADLVALNKFEKRGSLDALRAVRKQWRRNNGVSYDIPDDALPIFGTIASRFNDDGVNALYHALLDALGDRWPASRGDSQVPASDSPVTSGRASIIPASRTRYLSEIAEAVRGYHAETDALAARAQRLAQLDGSLAHLRDTPSSQPALDALTAARDAQYDALGEAGRALLAEWSALVDDYSGEQITYKVRQREITRDLIVQTQSDTRMPRVALPRYSDPGDQLRWLRAENVPGRFPYTAGVFPFKRTDEDPKRQFAGEGPPLKNQPALPLPHQRRAGASPLHRL